MIVTPRRCSRQVSANQTVCDGHSNEHNISSERSSTYCCRMWIDMRPALSEDLHCCLQMSMPSPQVSTDLPCGILCSLCELRSAAMSTSNITLSSPCCRSFCGCSALMVRTLAGVVHLLHVACT